MTGNGSRWVMTYELDAGRPVGPLGVLMTPGASMVVGREGDLPLGVEAFDRGVSRCAAEVSATAVGWDVEIKNTNGVVLHAWGQAPRIITGRQHLSWPRIALRVLNGDPSTGPDARLHWILFEADHIPVTPEGAQVGPSSTSRTFTPKPPQPLTAGQLEALLLVFAELLEWPPRIPANPAKLSTVARTLGITESGVQDRLKTTLEKALRLGLHQRCGLTEPEYLYVLVRAGFVPPPRAVIPRTEHPWVG